jgi:sensor domain CHASE-containing protein/signal transduction histidine kinase
MDLRTKTLIIFGAGLLLILAGFTVYSTYVLQKSYADIEHAEIGQDIEQVKFAIDNELSTLDSTLLDWSSWDDTYYFAQGNSSAYVEENLPKETYQTLDLSFLMMFNRSGDLIYAKSYNKSTGDLEQVSPSLLNKMKEEYPLFIFDAADRSSSVEGIFFADSQPSIVAVRPILKNNGDGPAEGTLVMGRNFDEDRVDKLSKSTGVTVTFIDPAIPSETPSLSSIQGQLASENFTVLYLDNPDTVVGYTQLKEFSSAPASYILEVKEPRVIYQSGISTIYSFLFIVLIAALIFGILGLMLIDRLVLSRVNTITTDVQKIGSGKEITRITEVDGNDELTQLSRAINQMLEKISLARLRYQSIVEDQTELICRFNPDGRITFMNSAFKRIVPGLRGDLDTVTFYDLNSSPISRERMEIFIKTLTPHSPIGSGEQEFTFESEDYSISWTIRAIFDSRGILQEYQFVGSDITIRKQAQTALQQVTRKLTLLNQVTFNDIQNAVFTLNGYLALEKILPDGKTGNNYHDMEMESVRKIENSLKFAKNYQDLGLKPPEWQNVHQVFIMGISHLDFSSVQRIIHLDNLEIYADSLLERVFFTLAGNVLRHAKNATEVTLGYQLTEDGLVLFFEDNGGGIPKDNKEKIFERGYGTQQGMELFLVREILGITGITIQETGRYGSGARFEMNIPKREYRFPNKK